jgi:hypothetical protein
VAVLSFSLLLVVIWSALPGTALAQAKDGVHVDPDSAPAKEYALPLDAARGAAGSSTADGPSSKRPAGAPAPAFGSGITPRAASRTRGSRSTAGSAGRDSERQGAKAGSRDDDTTTEPAVSPTPVAEGGAKPILYSLGGVLAVLAAGGLVALTLRRRQSAA